MTTRIARNIGALVVALAAWLPVAAYSQQPAAPAQPPAAAAAPAQAAPAPDWNTPPSWNDVSTKAQYASVPGRETNVHPERHGDVRGRVVAVVDDVLTTGATAREATLALRRAGAAAVQVWTVARTA